MDIAYRVLSASRDGVERIVRRIGMAGNEIDGELLLRGERKELHDPDALPLLVVDRLLRIEDALLVVLNLPVVPRIGDEVARRGTADFQLGRYVFDGLRAHPVELEVIAPGALEKAVVEVRLVPHLEIPLLDLVESVAFDDVPDERLAELAPLRQLRAIDCNAVAVPHLAARILGGEAGREERELHEGPHALGEHPVVHLVNVLPAVHHSRSPFPAPRSPLLLRKADEHVVVERVVHAHVAEAAVRAHVA